MNTGNIANYFPFSFTLFESNTSRCPPVGRCCDSDLLQTLPHPSALPPPTTLSISRPVPASAGAIRYAVVLDAFRQQPRSPPSLRGMVIGLCEIPLLWFREVVVLKTCQNFCRLTNQITCQKRFSANGNMYFTCFQLSHLIGQTGLSHILERYLSYRQWYRPSLDTALYSIDPPFCT